MQPQQFRDAPEICSPWRQQSRGRSPKSRSWPGRARGLDCLHADGQLQICGKHQPRILVSNWTVSFRGRRVRSLPAQPPLSASGRTLLTYSLDSLFEVKRLAPDVDDAATFKEEIGADQTAEWVAQILRTLRQACDSDHQGA
jgi:hypothetical protein